jgi:hypothetical protein
MLLGVLLRPFVHCLRQAALPRTHTYAHAQAHTRVQARTVKRA